jgi:acetyl-CoA carboxylase biotin carboxyl carrier protein
MDLRKLKTLIDLVQQSGIAELEITEGEEKVRISRGSAAHPAAAAPPVTLVPTSSAGESDAGGAPRPAVAAAATEAAAPEGHVLKSPMVGTFYRAPAPGSKPFVEPGQAVKAGDVVCVIEAMKLLNEIEADHDGVIETILVENGQPVEYGQPLIIIA